jgi:Domain of unknown function (DUF4440)
MSSAARVLPDLERTRLRALVEADIETAEPLHAEDYQLVTPNGSDLTKDDYLGAIGTGELRYRVFEAASDITVLPAARRALAGGVVAGNPDNRTSTRMSQPVSRPGRRDHARDRARPAGQLPRRGGA